MWRGRQVSVGGERKTEKSELGGATLQPSQSEIRHDAEVRKQMKGEKACTANRARLSRVGILPHAVFRAVLIKEVWLVRQRGPQLMKRPRAGSTEQMQ